MTNGLDRLGIQMEITEKATDKQWDRLEEQGKQIAEALAQNRVMLERVENMGKTMSLCVMDLKKADILLSDRVTVNEYFRIKWAAVVGVGILLMTLAANLIARHFFVVQ